MDFAEMIRLESHGADVFVGTGPQYPWGGLYGGQIVAQALRAAASTVDGAFAPHSLRAYFIRAGDHQEPIRYEVDRIRNGGSFCTRRVVARQAVGAILNLEASFHRGDDAPSIHGARLDPSTPLPEVAEDDGWTTSFERRFVAEDDEVTGRARCWFRMRSIGVDDDPLLHASALAYISDDLPTDAVMRAMGLPPQAYEDGWFSVSLDHTIWFHRPIRADGWHLHDLNCDVVEQGRGLALGNVYGQDGTHVATVAQEVLVRRRRK